MNKRKPEDIRMPLTSANVVDERLERLRDLFPEAFREGKVDFERLRSALGDVVDEGRERYGLSWAGKSEAIRAIQIPSVGTLKPVPEESIDFDTTGNLFIEGDNLEVLKLLQNAYHGGIKMIYIDPPYNTGNDLIYTDDYRDSLGEYLRCTGQTDEDGIRMTTNAESEGRFHSRWLNMMYPRLFLARNLLANDGVIFISLDDHEFHHCRQIMDEIFGEENFVATFIWKKMDSPSRNDSDRCVSNYHDYILAYCRHRDAGGLFQMPKPEILKAYPLRHSDGRLARRRQLRKNGKNARREDRPSMWYPLIAPDGTEVLPIAPEGWEGRWVLSMETWDERKGQGLTEWIKRDYGWVPYYIELAPEAPSIPWSTLWTDVDQNRQAKAKFTSLMKGTNWTFENPKPVDLVKRMIAVGMGSDGVCLDFFSGSGSTGHAVMAANAGDGGTRRFILVQLPEALAGNSKGTLADICKARLKQASAEIHTLIKERDHSKPELDLDDAEQVAPIDVDIGFKAFKLAPSNFRIWHADEAPSAADELAKQLELYAENVLPGHSRQEILYELVLKAGFPLDVPIEERMVGKSPVFWIDGGALAICLEERVTRELLAGIMELKPSRVLCLDHAFGENDQLKTNAVLEMKSHGMVFQTV